jgi:hypothetical protein
MLKALVCLNIIFFCRPEALGLVVGIVYLVIAIIFQQFHYAPDSIVCHY